jgi:sporulation protein YlmC with PRC-barrel domain
MRWRDARHRDVVDTATAQRIGRLDGLVVDPDASAIVGVVVGERVVDWSDAGGIGHDAVTVSHEDLLHLPRSDAERAAVDGDTELLGKTVITEGGVDVGTVDDIDFDAESGVLERLHVGDDDVEGSRLLGAGSYAVVISSTEGATTGGRDTDQ